MKALDIILPGGLLKNGRRERLAKFRSLTGRIEQKLIDCALGHNRPAYVTTVLDTTLESIGNQAVNAECVANLCVADRQYLMLRLAAMLNGEQMWLKVTCGHCHALFDVEIRRCDLPVKEAGQAYPQVTIQLKEWTIEVRLPTGADQAQISHLSDEEAMQHLLRCCISTVNGQPPSSKFISQLSESDITAIDEALDEVSPAVCNQLLVSCPECHRQQHAILDHYALNGLTGNVLYDEVHTLASHYHWTEADILELPQTRRRLYLSMINRAVGVVE